MLGQADARVRRKLSDLALVAARDLSEKMENIRLQ
jgi:hypothetical protein